MSSPSRDDEQSDIFDELRQRANKMLISQCRVTEEGVDAIIEQLKVYKSSQPDSSPNALLCPPLITVLRVRSLLPDIFLNPPLNGFSAEDSKVLGEGKFGKVYMTRYQNEDVAVKVLKHEGTTTDDVRSFFQEVQSWKEVSKSPHIAPFKGCSVSVNRNPCFVFTFVSPLANGGTLRQYDIDQNSPLVTRKHIIDIAKGLRDLHELGYIHGDVHRDNILLFDGVAKLADFGLVKLANTVSAFSLAGRRQKLHPARVDSEVINGNVPRSPRSDVFSYGRLVYEMFDPDHAMFRDRSRLDNPPKPKKMEDASWNELWETLLPCWQPGARPTADNIVSRLNNIFK